MKQPNWKTPLILSASLLTLGTFAYWLQYSHKPKQEKADSALKKPLLVPENAQISLLKIKSSTGLIELKCESLVEKNCDTKSINGKWMITHPLNSDGKPYPTDLGAVKEFLVDTTTAIATETVDLSEDDAEKRKQLLDTYGVSDSKRPGVETQFVEVILDDGKGGVGKRITAWFGLEHPLGDKTFVASSVDGVTNDKTIFLMSNQFKNSTFSKGVTYFRDKSLFTFNRKDVTEFKTPKFTAKKVNELWQVNGMEANYDRIETVLSSIANARATEFADKTAIKGLKPLTTYEIKAKDQTVTFTLYEKTLKAIKLPKAAHKHDHHHETGDDQVPAEQHHYVVSSERDFVAEVEPIIKTNVDKSVNDLRNITVLSDTGKVTATQFTMQSNLFSAPVEFTLKSGSWTAKNPGQTWDPEMAKKTIDVLAKTKIKDFVKPQSGKPDYTISIGDDKNPTKFHWAFYPTRDHLYAQDLNKKDREAYLMDDTLKAAIPNTEDAWKIKPKK